MDFTPPASKASELTPKWSHPRFPCDSGLESVFLTKLELSMSHRTARSAAFCCLLPFTALLPAQVQRVSVDSSGAQANARSYNPSISDDGQVVAFTSYASNLVPGDTNNNSDVFVHSLQTGTTVRVSVSSSGAQGNGSSLEPAISGDGRFVAFISSARNLIPVDSNGSAADVFVHDLQNGTTELVNLTPTGMQSRPVGPFLQDCCCPSLSFDGRFVAFASPHAGLAPGDTNFDPDVYVRDRMLGSTSWISADPTGGAIAFGSSIFPQISSDGSLVAFVSSSDDLLAADVNMQADVFLRDLQSGVLELISVSSSGSQGDDQSGYSNGYRPAISGSGRYICFSSSATNLVSGDTNLNHDVFVRDRQLATTTRVSLDNGGRQIAQRSDGVAMSSDARYFAFDATDVFRTSSVTPLMDQAYVHDRVTGVTSLDSVNERASVPNGQLPQFRATLSMSASGRFLAFVSTSSNLVTGDTNGVADIFVRDGRALIASYGQACSPGTELVPLSQPLVGTTLTLGLESNLPNSPALLGLGFSQASVAVSPGCLLRVSVAFAIPLTTDAFGTGQASVAIPADPVLIGFEFFGQFGVTDLSTGVLTLSQAGYGVVSLP